MTRYPGACRRAKFVDIDFPDLLSKKRTIVLSTPELSSVFEPLEENVNEHVLLKSEMYAQIGCDLRNTTDVEKALSTCLNLEISDCTFMFVAEVSITYMEVRFLCKHRLSPCFKVFLRNLGLIVPSCEFTFTSCREIYKQQILILFILRVDCRCRWCYQMG